MNSFALQRADFIHGETCQIPQSLQLPLVHGARTCIEQTQCTDTRSVVQLQRIACVESDPWFPEHQWIVGKTFILEGIRDDQRFTMVDGMSAERGVTWALLRDQRLGAI